MFKKNFFYLLSFLSLTELRHFLVLLLLILQLKGYLPMCEP